jgi:hypothetical protein
MPEGTIPDPTDRGTQRPNAPPLQKKGDKFIPLECPDFEFEISLPPDVSPDDPITLFILYYTPEIIESIVQHTNNVVRKPQDSTQPRARANAWYPTCTKEIYLFLAIRIYMMLFPLDEVADYWNSNRLFPQHEITQLMCRDRFQELHMRYRVAPPTGYKTLWDRVCILSKSLLILLESFD